MLYAICKFILFFLFLHWFYHVFRLYYYCKFLSASLTFNDYEYKSFLLFVFLLAAYCTFHIYNFGPSNRVLSIFPPRLPNRAAYHPNVRIWGVDRSWGSSIPLQQAHSASVLFVPFDLFCTNQSNACSYTSYRFFLVPSFWRLPALEVHTRAL